MQDTQKYVIIAHDGDGNIEPEHIVLEELNDDDFETVTSKDMEHIVAVIPVEHFALIIEQLYEELMEDSYDSIDMG